MPEADNKMIGTGLEFLAFLEGRALADLQPRAKNTKESKPVPWELLVGLQLASVGLSRT